VLACAAAAGTVVAASGPLARVFFLAQPEPQVIALRDTILAFAPGLVGYGLVALLTRTLYARGHWKAPTVCVAGGWLLAVVADLVLSGLLPVADRGLALGAGHSIGVTCAGFALLVVVRREVGPVGGLGRVGVPAVVGAVLGAAAGLAVAALLGPSPVPGRNPLAAVSLGVLSGTTVLVIVGAVMMGTARGPLRESLRALRTPESTPDPSPTPQEVHGE
jgi:putative peptidoglycan lipid II flippase